MAKKEQSKLENLTGAARIMERLYQTGVYPALKKAEKHKDMLKESIKERLGEDEKRREFKKVGIIAKYQPVNVYETDWDGLMEYLADYGILVPMLEIDLQKLKQNPELHQTLTKHFMNPTEQYVRLTPNKNGKVQVDPLEVKGLKTDQLASMWKELHIEYKTFKTYVDLAKNQMERCPVLQKEKKLSCNYGSVSLLNKAPTFNKDAILEEFGLDVLMSIGKINSQSLDEYIEKGFISPSEIKQFRKVIDVELRFIVQTMESEEKQFQLFHKKLQRAAANRRIV